MAWSVLQSAVGTTGGSALTTATATFTTANISAGSKIIVAVACASSPAVSCSGVADGASNAWTKLATKALPAFGEVTLWALDVPAGDVGTKPAITATISAAGGIVVLAQEVSGLLTGNTTAMCDGTPATGGGTGGTSTGSPAYSTAAANEYLVSVYGDDGSAATWTVPAGYTGDANGVNTSTIDDLQIAYKNSTGGSETSSYTITSSGQGWSQVVVAFQLSSGGGTSVNAALATARGTAQQPGISGQVTSQGGPVNTHATSGSVTGTWPAGSFQVAGRLLVAVVTSAAATSTAALNTPAGWTKQLEEPNSATAHSRSVIYTKTAAGGDAAPTFTSTLSGTGGMDCMLFELIGADTTTITDTSGVFASGSSTATLANATFTATTSGNPHAGAFAIAVFNQERAAANLTFTDSGTGWTKLLNGNGVSSVCQTAILTQGSPSTGGTLNDHGQFSTDTTAFGTAIVYVFLAGGASATANAVLASGTGAALNTAFTYAHAGLATGAGAAASPVFGSFLTKILGTGEALYFADASGSPYLVRWDTPWALIVNAGNSGGATTYQTDMDGYCAARAAEGFNGFMCTPTANAAAGVGTFNNGNTWDGVAPFSSPGVLNNTFWVRVDYLIASAAAQGMTVCLNAMFTYAVFNTGGPLNGWTNTQAQNYGAAVGARYATTPNLVWEVGDDYNGSWVGGNSFYDTLFAAFLTGLRGAGANQLISVENMSEGSSRYSSSAGQGTYAWGISHAQFNWVYSYDPSYSSVEDAYTEAAANSVASLCNVRMDGWYDNEGSIAEAVALYGRKSYWWSLSSGSRGYMYGNNTLFPWPSGSLASGIAGSTPGSQYMQPGAIKTILDTFASFPGWHLLVPDTSSALVTAGRGTRHAESGAGALSSGSQYTGGNTYVSASITPSGSLAVIYIPAHATITVNGSLMTAGYTASWVDPASGAATTATIGSTYNSTGQGTNSAGDADWLLVLAAATGTSVTAVLAAGTGAAQGPVAAIGVNAVLASGTGAAQSPAVTTTASVTAVLASGTGAAQSPAAAVGVNAGLASGAGAALNATASTSASGTGTAAVATGTGTAQSPVPAIGVNAALATGTGAALNATASTSSSGSANAVLATGSGAAQGPAAAIGVSAVLASGTGTAQQPSAATAASVTAGLASGAGAALNATVQTSGSANAAAVLATGTGAAQSPAAAVAVNAAAATGSGTAQGIGRAAAAGLATGTGAAQAVTAILAAQARAQAAQALAAALNATGAGVEPFTVGTLTARDAPLATLTASDTSG